MIMWLKSCAFSDIISFSIESTNTTAIQCNCFRFHSPQFSGQE